MSDLPLAWPSEVEELRAALATEREINARLREVIASQAQLHVAELAVRDRQIADLADRVSQLERRVGRDSAMSGRPPSSEGLYTKERKKPTDRSPVGQDRS